MSGGGGLLQDTEGWATEGPRWLLAGRQTDGKIVLKGRGTPVIAVGGAHGGGGKERSGGVWLGRGSTQLSLPTPSPPPPHSQPLPVSTGKGLGEAGTLAP